MFSCKLMYQASFSSASLGAGTGCCIRSWCAGRDCSGPFRLTDPTQAILPKETGRNLRALRRQTHASRTLMKYADAGVDIAVADAAKQRIRHHASRTFTPGVLGGIGGFGALFAMDRKEWKEPVLVSSADGVGTKL